MSKQATTETSMHDDGTFVRTALHISGGDSGSIVVLDKHGGRLAVINIFHSTEDGEDTFMVDVIDIDKRFTKRKALVFSRTEGRQYLEVPDDDNLVAVDFRK